MTATLDALTADADARALLAAIDVFDDACLPLLADRLEEIGDARATGMRRVCVLHPAKMPNRIDGRWCWERARPRRAYLFHHLIARVFDRLPPLDAPGRKGAPAMHYPTRSTAYLALAEALSVAAPAPPR